MTKKNNNAEHNFELVPANMDDMRDAMIELRDLLQEHLVNRPGSTV